MATVSGGAAYQQLERLDNQISDNANKAADRAAANMRHKRALNAQQKEADQKRQDEVFEKNKYNPEDFAITPTTHNDADKVSADIAESGYAIVLENEVEAQKLYRSGDKEGAEKLWSENKKIKSDFDNSQKSLSGLEAAMKSYRELLDSGAVVDEELASAIQSFNTGSYRGKYVKGEGIVTSVAVLDANGEQKIDPETGEPMYKVYNMADLQKELLNPYTVSKMYDKDSDVNSFASNLGTKTWDDEKGDYTYTNQEWDDVREVATQNFLDIITGDVNDKGEYTSVPNNRKMYDYLYQLTGTEKKKDFTKEEKDLVRNKLYGYIKGQYSEESSITTNPLTKTEKKAENEADRQLRIGLQEDAQEFEEGEAGKKREHDWKMLQEKLKNANTPAATKGELENEAYIWALDVAEEIGSLNLEGLTRKQKDAKIKPILEREGISFDYDLDWFGDYQIDVGGKDDVNPKHKFKVVEGIVKESGAKFSEKKLNEILAQRRLNKGQQQEEDTGGTTTGVQPTDDDPLGLGI